jgi:hypothetical protein
MAHFRIETLEQYSLQRLPKTRVGGVEKHLLICSSCRDRLDALELFIQAVQGGGAELLELLLPGRVRNRFGARRSEPSTPLQLTLWGSSSSVH